MDGKPIDQRVRRALADEPLPLFASEVRQHGMFAHDVCTGQFVREWAPDSSLAQEIVPHARELRRFVR